MGKKTKGQEIDSKKQKKRKWRIPFRIPRFLIPKDEPIVPRPFSPIDYAGGVVVFFICWAVYLHTLTPTIGFHDSGDMVTAAYVLGIPHPTGYPLYCLLGKLWMTFLPIGNIAYRMNLASALCASLACMMVYFIVLKVGAGLVPARVGIANQSNGQTQGLSLHQLIPAMVAALMLAFATTFWEQAVIAEKYTLNALFATLLIFILLKWQEAMIGYKNPKSEINSQFTIRNSQFYLYLFAFTLGLSFTHHMQTIYLVPASIFFIIVICWQNRKHSSLILHPSFLVKMLCLFILPLFLYLYLPIQANKGPLYNGGDPDTLERFIEYISGGNYKSRYITSKWDLLKIKEYMGLFSYQFTSYFMWIGVIGIFSFFKRKLLLVSFCVIIITNIFFAIQYNIPNIKDYYIISYSIFSILIGLGGREIIRRCYFICNQKIKLHILYIFILFFPIILFLTHYHLNNYHDYYLAYDYNRNILTPLKEKAISIFAVGYDEVIFPSTYIQWVENERDDVSIIMYVVLSEDLYIDSLKKNYPHLVINLPSQKREKEITAEVLEKIKRERLNNIIVSNIDKYPIYTNDKELFSNYQLIPGAGILLRVLKKGISRDNLCEEFNRVNLNLRGIYKGKINRKYPTPREKVIIENYAFIYNAEGSFYYYFKEYDKAIVSVRKALEINPNSQESYYLRNNMQILEAIKIKEKGER